MIRLAWSAVRHTALLLALLAGAARAGDCVEPPAKPFVPEPKNASFKKLPWVDAFEALHARLSEEYPFTAWRDVDWPALRAEALAEVGAAAADDDAQALYLALRRYIAAVPDGHLYVSDHDALWQAQVGGGFGLAVALLDDGRVLVHRVWDDGPAELAGVQAGAELLQWDGEPAVDAAADVSVLWAEQIPGVAANRVREQYRFLVRAQVGQPVDVVVRNPGATSDLATTLVAVDDDGATLDFTAPDPVGHGFAASVLPSGLGYARVTAETGKQRKKLRKALKAFGKQSVPGLVLDLRGNEGGSSTAATAMAAPFHDEPAFFEHTVLYDRKDEDFRWETKTTETVVPGKLRFDAPVVVLVDSGTISSGEGLAWSLQALPQVQVMGFDGTNGAVGFTDVTIRMPTGIEIAYPFGRAVDECFEIMIESDAAGLGGVLPDLLIPRTEGRMLALGAGQDVLLTEAEAWLLAAAGR